MFKIHTIVITTLVVLFAATAASANMMTAQDRKLASVEVSFAELDLSNEAGVSELYARLQQAAEAVCGLQTRESSTLSSIRTTKVERRQCYQKALDRAISRIDTPLLDMKHSS